jgi:hypothetical protein
MSDDTILSLTEHSLKCTVAALGGKEELHAAKAKTCPAKKMFLEETNAQDAQQCACARGHARGASIGKCRNGLG